MILKSEFGQQIYWRTFKHNDPLHLVGLSDGTLQTHQQLDIRENDVSFQLEVKVGDVFSLIVLLPAGLGLQYHDTDRGVLIDSKGQVQRV